MNVRYNNRPFTTVFFVFFFEIVLGVKLCFSFVDFYVAALRLAFSPKSAFNLHFYYETKYYFALGDTSSVTKRRRVVNLPLQGQFTIRLFSLILL